MFIYIFYLESKTHETVRWVGSRTGDFLLLRDHQDTNGGLSQALRELLLRHQKVRSAWLLSPELEVKRPASGEELTAILLQDKR